MNNINLNRRMVGKGLIAAAGVLAAPSIVRAQESFSWRLQTVDPSSFVGPSVVLPKFAKRVEEMSGGQLKMTIFAAGQLVPTGEIPAALNAGTIDIAYSNPTYYTGAVPESAITASALPPLLIPTRQDAQELYWNRGLDEIQRDAYAKEGVHFIASTFAGDVVTFWSRSAVGSIDDLQGLKMRTYGYAAKVLEKLGGSPVFIPHEEVYTALSQGVIDATMTASTSYTRAKYNEVAPYFSISPWYTAHGMAMMASSRSWEALPDHLKAIVESAAYLISTDIEQATRLEDELMRSELADKKVETVAWPKQDSDKLRRTGMEFLPEIAATAPAVSKGVSIIEEYLKQTNRV
jgi:TRAP-type C4-dicarboxylate transport system substrate-binding protein